MNARRANNVRERLRVLAGVRHQRQEPVPLHSVSVGASGQCAGSGPRVDGSPQQLVRVFGAGAALQGLIGNVSYDVSGGFLVASFSRVLAATSVESAVVLGRNLSGDVNMNW